MTRRTLKAPTPARVNASELLSSAASKTVYLTLAITPQGASLAASRLSRRFGLAALDGPRGRRVANRWGR